MGGSKELFALFIGVLRIKYTKLSFGLNKSSIFFWEVQVMLVKKWKNRVKSLASWCLFKKRVYLRVLSRFCRLYQIITKYKDMCGVGLFLMVSGFQNNKFLMKVLYVRCWLPPSGCRPILLSFGEWGRNSVFNVYVFHLVGPIYNIKHHILVKLV